MKTNKIICPVCEGQGVHSDGYLCGVCENGFIKPPFNEKENDAIEPLLAELSRLQQLLDPYNLAKAIAKYNYEEQGDSLCLKFGGDGDSGEYLLEALYAIMDVEPPDEEE